MIDIGTLTEGLQAQAGGIWLSDNRSAVSHPDECQDWYLAVEDSSYWFQHRAACIVECLRRFPPQGPFFDVGGGNGHVSMAIKAAGFAPVLLEPCLAAARNAERRGLSPIICATLEDAGFRAGSLPAVGAFDVLEHVEDDARFLRTVRQALVSEGLLYLTVPAFQWLWSDYDRYVGHHRRYSLPRLIRLLADCGYRTELASYLYLPLPLPIFLMRALPSRLGLAQRDLNRFQREHAAGRGIAARIMESLLARERKWLAAGRAVPLGSSCLVVARTA